MALPSLELKDSRKAAIIGLGIGAFIAVHSNGIIPIINITSCLFDTMTFWIELGLSVFVVALVIFPKRVGELSPLSEKQDVILTICLAMIVIANFAIAQVLDYLHLLFVQCT